MLAGGQTHLPAYRLLAGPELPWAQIHLIPSDERCAEVSSPMRNGQQILAALGEKAPLYRFPAELGPKVAALRMEEVVRSLLPFAVVVLGLAEDGHTASLFPGHVNYETLVVPVYHASKPPSERVTLTPKALAVCWFSWPRGQASSRPCARCWPKRPCHPTRFRPPSGWCYATGWPTLIRHPPGGRRTLARPGSKEALAPAPRPRPPAAGPPRPRSRGPGCVARA